VVVPGQLYRDSVNATRSSPQLFLFSLLFSMSSAVVVTSGRLSRSHVISHRQLYRWELFSLLSALLTIISSDFIFHFCVYEYTVVLQMRRHITCNPYNPYSSCSKCARICESVYVEYRIWGVLFPYMSQDLYDIVSYFSCCLHMVF
jgi:hypothetical protein